MLEEQAFEETKKLSNWFAGCYEMEKHPFTKEKIISLEELMENMENCSYIDVHWGYEDDFYIESLYFYLNKLKRMEKNNEISNKQE